MTSIPNVGILVGSAHANLKFSCCSWQNVMGPLWTNTSKIRNFRVLLQVNFGKFTGAFGKMWLATEIHWSIWQNVVGHLVHWPHRLWEIRSSEHCVVCQWLLSIVRTCFDKSKVCVLTTMPLQWHHKCCLFWYSFCLWLRCFEECFVVFTNPNLPHNWINKIAKIEFLLLDWIYCSIRIMTNFQALEYICTSFTLLPRWSH